MPIAVSNRFLLNPSEKETLAMLEDVEEGEISSDEDLQQDVSRSSSGVWVGDRVQFPVLGRHYSTNLYNFAWAQAVQNKPLGNFGFEGFMPAEGAEEEVYDVVDGGEEYEDRVEKEEGELEEGEFGSFDTEVAGEVVCDVPKEEEKDEEEVMKEEEKLELEKAENKKEMEEVGDFDVRVASILEDLDTMTVEDAEKSFVGACTRLQKIFDILHLMVSESHIPVLDTLVQQAFVGVQTVHSVFLKRKEHNEDVVLLRLLSHMKNQVSALFTPEQMKEINLVMQSMVSEDVSKEKEVRPCLERIPLKSSSGTNATEIPFSSKLHKPEQLFISKSRIDHYPLLDPRAEHDEGSLPSPTRDNTPPLHSLKSYVAGSEPVTSLSTSCKQEETEVARLHPYLVDALKAVSSYQRKHCYTSFISSDKLPSPTPSEECNDDDEDSHGEVSSSLAVSSVRTIDSSVSVQSIGPSSAAACMVGSSGQKLLPEKIVGQMSFGLKSVAKALAKSRDPRLRFANPGGGNALGINRQSLPFNNSVPKSAGAIVISRKHKIADEPVLDNLRLKRQRNGILNRDLPVSSRRGAWLGDDGVVAAQPSGRRQSVEVMDVENKKTENGEVGFDRGQDINLKGANVRNSQVSAMITTPIVSLPSLLKDIAGNPTILMNLIKEQQRLAAEVQLKAPSLTQYSSKPSSTNSLSGAVSSINSTPLSISEPEQKSTAKLQLPVQTASLSSQSDGGKIRMKPRDPRRVLHSNVVQKSENLGSEQLNANGDPSSTIQRSKDVLTVQEHGQQPPAALPSQAMPPPDIAKQFTTKLRNLANIISTSQVTNNSQSIQSSSQPLLTKTDKMDVGPVATESNNQPSLPVVADEENRIGASQLSNQWADVDHLLDGYDDQQKATIQIERARRIEDQNRMFASRKLSLVLDLDHTLLNSAKFVEVDQVHDEILRRKEEQDREAPQRHLFRFQHMGMWTKLRPGIWNFLKKASKLYELHVYTMGNKLYASEMAKVLDPSGSLFAGRVISKGDDSDSLEGDERLPKSKDLDGVLGMESAVVIIDDSVRVWPHHRLNLIVVERYTYFPCSRRQFGLPGPSLLEIDHDERPEDGTLASSLAVIERIHHNFFSHHSLNNIDVRNILASEQCKILSGCRIVFSRIFPVGEANPHLHPLWQTAEQFGAVCTNQIDDQVTHVVANSLGTDKVNWALSRGRFVVYPGWVEASTLLYRRANEIDFAVKI